MKITGESNSSVSIDKLLKTIDTLIAQDKSGKSSSGRDFIIQCLIELNQYKAAEELGLITVIRPTC